MMYSNKPPEFEEIYKKIALANFMSILSYNISTSEVLRPSGPSTKALPLNPTGVSARKLLLETHL